ncbi:response regulator [candidate division KSB1 bacterium]|nr:response regulator [candidate division KSB1 bacterium]
MSANIIVAASDTNVINALNTILIDRNYSILVEHSNTSAILKVLDEKIELLIVDLDMNINTTVDFIRIVRKTRPRLPIIVLSENPKIETIQEILNMGVYYWTFKPVLPNEINKFIDAIEVIKKKGEK